FGGGEGMLLKPEPVFAAVETIFPERQGGERDPERRVILLSAQGRKFHLADEELTVGDYVLSGGELAAAVVIDVIARLLPGVLGNADSAVFESFGGESGVLDCPQYTRPADFRGWRVPEALLSGNHEQIRRWRAQA